MNIKNWSILCLCTFFSIVSFAGCSKTEEAAVNVQQNFTNKKILIVYLSRTKNTEAVAKMINQQVGGTLAALELQNPYPANYQATVQQVQQENETGFLPPLKTKIDSIGSFDVIFIGFPTWGMQLPPPVKTFLTENNLSGKTVIPFNTNAGYGLGNSITTFKQFCTSNNVLNAFSVQGGIERDGILFVMQGKKEVQVRTAVKEWLSKLQF